MPRYVVYTALYGSRNTLLEQPIRKNSEIDFIAFVDDPTATSESWTLRQLPPLIPTDLPRSQRFAKLCAHRVLPEYDISLYIDSKVRLKVPPETVFQDLLVGHTDTMACFRHDERTSIFDEAEAIIQYSLDRPELCRTQLSAYLRDGYTGTVPLIWGGILLRFHNNPRVQQVMESWYAQVLRYSRRDQLSFPYVSEKLGLQFCAHILSNRDTKWHEWPITTESERENYWEEAMEGLNNADRTIAATDRDLAIARGRVVALEQTLLHAEQDRLDSEKHFAETRNRKTSLEQMLERSELDRLEAERRLAELRDRQIALEQTLQLSEQVRLESQEQITRLQNEISAIRQDIADIAQAKTDTDLTLETAQRLLKAAHEDVDHTQSALTAILTSTSWRITKIPRRIANAIRSAGR